ncbi:TFIIB-type zinc ribbon-containing protein [Salinimicrobium flavum]|uniref:Zf-TFIIB domain-containing protein n=1 Tax=Salinimicrobium flavum TaxID=1737065 RepID=A0ABW5IUJ8_9FLAO
MKCPNDNTTLVMTERSGVEIDYCPECRGVWLDRGELDKIIERSAPQAQKNQDYQPRSDKNYNSREGSYQKPRKKESFLGDLFDF